MSDGEGAPPRSKPPSDAPKKKRKRRPSRAPKEPRDAKTSKAARGFSIAKWTATIAASLVMLAAGAFLFAYPKAHGPGDGRDVELVIPGDESADALSERLASAGLVGSPRLFSFYLRLTGGPSQVAPGTHLVTDDLSPRDLLARLDRGISAGHIKVTFPEGWTRFDMARRLQEKHVCTLRTFLDATAERALLDELRIEASTAEGFLFPATYDLPFDSDPREVVKRMKSEFERRYAIAEQRRASGILDLSQSLGWGRNQIVTLASMIEKEAVMDDERPIIASVFVNRLRDPAFTPKLLQCDPTAGYGCLQFPGEIASCASYTGKITHDIVADPSNPYNTYKHEGLPPGPIANPGARSLDAAMQPATTHFLYFVAKGEGRHTFSETYAGHTSAIHQSAAPKP